MNLSVELFWRRKVDYNYSKYTHREKWNLYLQIICLLFLRIITAGGFNCDTSWKQWGTFILVNLCCGIQLWFPELNLATCECLMQLYFPVLHLLVLRYRSSYFIDGILRGRVLWGECMCCQSSIRITFEMLCQVFHFFQYSKCILKTIL